MHNRDTLYTVIRRYGILNNDKSVHLLETCRTADRAQELADAYTQEYVDRGIVGFKFEVQVTHYVDE